MERASGAVLGEGGSEVDLRRLFTLNKENRLLFCHPERKRRTRVLSSRRLFFPDASWLDRRPYSNTEETPCRGRASLSGEKLHRSLASLRMTAVLLILV